MKIFTYIRHFFHFHPSLYVSLPLSIAVFLVYAGLIPSYPVNIADTNELITAAYFRGVAHPPGYPLYTFILHLVMHAPLKTNPIFHAHLTSALLQSINLGLFFYISLILIRSIKNQKNWKGIYALSALGTLLLSFTYFFLSSATHAEVFPLHLFFASLILIFLLKYQPRYALIIFTLLGFATAHHQSILLLVPAIVYTLVTKTRHLPWLRAFLGFVAGFCIPYLFLFFTNPTAPLSWQFQPNLSGYLTIITRQVYAYSSLPDSTLTTSNLSSALISISHLLQQTIKQVHIVGIFFSLIGLVSLFKINKNYFFILTLSLLFTGPVLAAYFKFPDPNQVSNQYYLYSLSLTLRQFQLFLYLLCITIAVGIAASYFAIRSKFSSFLATGFIIGIILLITYQLVTYVTYFQSIPTDFDQQFSYHVLQSLPEKSLLIVDNDYVFALIQAQSMDGIRPDILIVPTALHMRWGYLQSKLPQEIFDSQGYYQLILSLVQWGFESDHPTYVLDPSQNFIDQMTAFNYHLNPYGYSFQITPAAITSPQKEFDYNLTQQLIEFHPRPLDYWSQFTQAKFAAIHLTLSKYSTNPGQHQDIKNQLKP